MDGEDEAKNLEAQARLYGEPLGVLLKRYGEVLRVTQRRLAELLGVSAPMLSQLANGRRVRFGNPVAVQRLQAMDAAVRAIQAGELAVDGAVTRLETNQASDVFTTTRSMDEAGLETARRIFAAAGTSDEHAAAAGVLDAGHPAIAEMLRVYGAGTDQVARRRFADAAGG